MFSNIFIYSSYQSPFLITILVPLYLAQALIHRPLFHKITPLPFKIWVILIHLFKNQTENTAKTRWGRSKMGKWVVQYFLMNFGSGLAETVARRYKYKVSALRYIYFLMNYKGLLLSLAAILLILAVQTSALQYSHLASVHFATSSSLQTLMQEQVAFEKSINGLIANFTVIQQQVNGTQNTTQKVRILSSAIQQEGRKVAQLQQSIVPPFNYSKTGCQQFTSQQKANLLSEVNSTKVQLAKLTNLSLTMTANPELTQIKTTISEQ